MASKEYIYRDLSYPRAVIEAMSPEERVNHDVAIQLGGRFAAGPVIRMAQQDEIEGFRTAHPEAYDQLVCDVTTSLIKRGIIPSQPVPGIYESHDTTPQSDTPAAKV